MLLHVRTSFHEHTFHVEGDVQEAFCFDFEEKLVIEDDFFVVPGKGLEFWTASSFGHVHVHGWDVVD